MRRNRKRQLQVRVLPRWVAGIIVLLVTLVLGYWFMDSKSAMLGQEIRKYEQKYAALENERVREEARWNEKKTPEKLEQAMLQHGIAMSYPTPEQVVRMDGVGVPLAGQLSVMRFQRNRNASERVAKANPR
ncbi:MAG: hypothetical protein WCK89_12485 [bacterium]